MGRLTTMLTAVGYQFSRVHGPKGMRGIIVHTALFWFDHEGKLIEVSEET